MEFQNSSIHGSFDMACIKKRDERTHARMHNPKAICHSKFKVGGIKMSSFMVR